MLSLWANWLQLNSQLNSPGVSFWLYRTFKVIQSGFTANNTISDEPLNKLMRPTHTKLCFSYFILEGQDTGICFCKSWDWETLLLLLSLFNQPCIDLSQMNVLLYSTQSNGANRCADNSCCICVCDCDVDVVVSKEKKKRYVYVNIRVIPCDENII